MDNINTKRIQFAQTLASMQKRLGEQLCQTLAHPDGKVYNPISVMDELRMWATHIEIEFVLQTVDEKSAPKHESRIVYIIERDINERVRYWRPSTDYDSTTKEFGDWVTEDDLGFAVYFASEDSARQVLYRACGGIGRIVKRPCLFDKRGKVT